MGYAAVVQPVALNPVEIDLNEAHSLQPESLTAEMESQVALVAARHVLPGLRESDIAGQSLQPVP